MRHGSDFNDEAVVRELVELLGAKLVAYIADVTETRADRKSVV